MIISRARWVQLGWFAGLLFVSACGSDGANGDGTDPSSDDDSADDAAAADDDDDDSDDDDDGSDDDGSDDDDGSPGAPAGGDAEADADAGTDDSPAGDDAADDDAVVWGCDVAEDRIVPDEVPLDNKSIGALGRMGSGVSGVGTRHTTLEHRYVSAIDGDDGADGSERAPWQSLQYAADNVEPDTTVWVDSSGPYGAVEFSRGGEEGAYVIFRALDADEPPLVEGDAGEDAVVRISSSFFVFQGFEVANHQRGSLSDDTIGIVIEASGALSHIEVRNNLVHDIGPPGLDDASCYYNGHGIIAQSEGSSISFLTIDGNELYDLYVGNSEVLVVNGNVQDFCVTSNYVHDVNNIAIDIIGYEKNNTETTERGLIADNVVLDASNYWPYCSRGNCTYPAGDESSDGIYVDGGAELEIAYNIVGRADHGIELQSENGELIRDVEVHDNLVFNSNYKNFTLGDADNSREFDNVFVQEAALVDEVLEGCK